MSKKIEIMSYIETYGNTKLLAITENEYPQLWAEMTSNGEAWEKYNDSMANGEKTVLAAEYNGEIYPLFDQEGDYNIPFFKQHGGQWKIAIEAEVANNHIYLLQAYPYPTDDYNRTQVVEKFKIKNSKLPTVNNTTALGTETLGWESSGAFLEDHGQGEHWNNFKSNYSFFKKFGGETASVQEGEEETIINEGDFDAITAPTKFNKKSADKITNFNPSTDTLEIDTDSFGIDSSATFASGKNKKKVKRKLAKKDFDFLYDEKKGGLYFNENGADKGFGEGGIIAILKGAPDLTVDDLEFM